MPLRRTARFDQYYTNQMFQSHRDGSVSTFAVFVRNLTPVPSMTAFPNRDTAPPLCCTGPSIKQVNILACRASTQSQHDFPQSCTFCSAQLTQCRHTQLHRTAHNIAAIICNQHMTAKVVLHLCSRICQEPAFCGVKGGFVVQVHSAPFLQSRKKHDYRRSTCVIMQVL